MVMAVKKSLFKGNDLLKLAIAVAPVLTNWRFYDSIYTTIHTVTGETQVVMMKTHP
jgi:hypothetical protein